MPRERHPRRRIWAVASILAVLIHLAAGLVVQAQRWAFAEPAPEDPSPVEMVFAPPREPNRFVEQPDTPDAAPETPDFLSNVDSRSAGPDPARTDDGLPAQTGLADAPSVRLDRGESAPPAPAPEPEGPEESPESGEDPVPPDESLRAERSLLGALVRRAPLPSAETPPTEAGNFDISQEAMERALNGASLRDDDIRLSTYAWEFAPWLQAFRRDVLEHWNPPAAYFMGLIHGWTSIRLEVARDGTPISAVTLEEDVGHRSLTSAAHLALDGAAPYRRLPDDFPDETLVLEIRFTYPDVRRARAPRGEPR